MPTDGRTRRERKLDTLLAPEGGVKAYVIAARNRGELISDIARRLAFLMGEKLAARTLYKWVRRWDSMDDEGAVIPGREEAKA